jgi:DnaJ-class molecular chaperone
MGWLLRLLGIEPFDSEEYERVLCDRCRGTGYPQNRHTLLYPSQQNWTVRCGKCNGKGYVVVEKPT